MPAKELKVYGETVLMPVSNIVNDDGTEWTPPPDIPTPSASDNGDLLGVSNGAYALIDPSSLTVGNATSATNAVNATNDGNGNNIVNTYAKKTEIPTVPSLRYQHNIMLTKADETSLVFSVLLPSSTPYGSVSDLCSAIWSIYGLCTLNATGYWEGHDVITSFWTSSGSTLGVNYVGGTQARDPVTGYNLQTDHVVALTN